MDDILERNIDEIAGLSFECSCGNSHNVNIDNIFIGNNIFERLNKLVLPFSNRKILLISDINTYEVLGKQVKENIKTNNIKAFMFNTTTLIPNEEAIGRIMVEIDDDVKLIVVVGSGVLNDLVKYVSNRTKIPCIIIATAPSMDGYASVVSPIIIDGVKKTLSATVPIAILSDVEILKNAPFEMIQAGFGDMIGKFTALADWNLSKTINNEKYCNTIVQIVRDALCKCIDNVEGLLVRDTVAVQSVMEGLILSGIAIGLHGNSRPASGSEHNFAHYWDMDAIANNRDHALHGNSVAVGTIITSEVYGMLKEHLPNDFVAPNHQNIINYINKMKLINNPLKLGISKELFIRSMYKAMYLKDRYTIFHLAKEKGLLEIITKTLTDKYYS